MRRSIPAVASALVAVALLVSGALALAAPRPTEVEIRVFQFRPGRLEVAVGTPVTWTNGDDIAHTVTSGTPEARDDRFERRLDGRGATATLSFSRPGVYAYFCDRHPSMRGEIRVH
jgi:plastocyanin